MPTTLDTYKVILYEVGSEQASTTFGVQAIDVDEARAKAKEWLRVRAYTVRAVSLAANQTRTLIAYAVPSKKK